MISRLLAEKIESKGWYPKDFAYWEGVRLSRPQTLNDILNYECKHSIILDDTRRVLIDYDYCGMATTGFSCIVIIEGISIEDIQALEDEGWNYRRCKGLDRFSHTGIGEMI